MNTAPTPFAANNNDDPVLALCQRWRSYRDEEERLAKLWSDHEVAVSRASPADRPEAELTFGLIEQAQQEATHNVETYFDAIFRLPAASMEGAVAKLEVMLVQFQPGPAVEEEPWPHLRGVLSDMRRLVPRAASAI